MSFEGVAAIRMIPAAPRNLWATAWWRYARNPVRVLGAAGGGGGVCRRLGGLRRLAPGGNLHRLAGAPPGHVADQRAGERYRQYDPGPRGRGLDRTLPADAGPDAGVAEP